MFFALLILLSLILFILAIPITLILQLSTPRDRYGELEICWLFGLVRVPVFFSQFFIELDKKSHNPKWKKRQTHKSAYLMKMASQPAVFHRVLRFANDIWRATHRENVQINLRIGLGDPADTGILWGIVGPIVAILNDRSSVICVEPAFFDAALDIKGSGKIRFYPITLFWLTVRLLASLTILRVQPLLGKESST